VITLIPYKLGVKKTDNSKGGEKILDIGWRLNFIHKHKKEGTMENLANYISLSNSK